MIELDRLAQRQNPEFRNRTGAGGFLCGMEVLETFWRRSGEG
jgi:hypothetical protein